MDLSLARQLIQTPDLAHRLRRLSFFDAHFRRQVKALADRNGLVATIDAVRLTRAFLAWGEDFTQQRAAAALDRRDYIVFTAATLLVRLLEIEPIAVARRPGADAADSAQPIVGFWPEGFLYTEYCLTVLQAVLQQEFGEGLAMTRFAEDKRIWQSFRENVAEDPASAIGFFDLFVGAEPNWSFPAVAAQRPAILRAAVHKSAPPSGHAAANVPGDDGDLGT